MDAFNTIMAIVVVIEQIILLVFIIRDSIKKEDEPKDTEEKDDFRDYWRW